MPLHPNDNLTLAVFNSDEFVASTKTKPRSFAAVKWLPEGGRKPDFFAIAAGAVHARKQLVNEESIVAPCEDFPKPVVVIASQST